MDSKKKEYSKISTTVGLIVFCTLAVGFVIFVCYEMHRLADLSPVAYLGPPIVAIPTAILGFYMSRAKAKSKTDLEWEKTKQLTLFREQHPEFFTQGMVEYEDDMEVG